MDKEKYKFQCFDRNSKDFRFIITKDGHTMFPEDIVKELNQNNKLEKQKIKFIKLIEYCCYNEDFDADLIITKLKEIISE